MNKAAGLVWAALILFSMPAALSDLRHRQPSPVRDIDMTIQPGLSISRIFTVGASLLVKPLREQARSYKSSWSNEQSGFNLAANFLRARF
jgi:hypothetical protein